jgi:hypothetical protein
MGIRNLLRVVSLFFAKKEKKKKTRRGGVTFEINFISTSSSLAGLVPLSAASSRLAFNGVK